MKPHMTDQCLQFLRLILFCKAPGIAVMSIEEHELSECCEGKQTKQTPLPCSSDVLVLFD
eukprot:86055-Pelagomonas_calceolata.AAC.5